MRKILERILKGAQYTEKYGYHPGDAAVILWTMVGAVNGGWAGGLLMFELVTPLYLYSCYKRGE